MEPIGTKEYFFIVTQQSFFFIDFSEMPSRRAFFATARPISGLHLG